MGALTRTPIEAQGASELGHGRGPDSRLGILAALYEDVQKTRRQAENRAFASEQSEMGEVGWFADSVAEAFRKQEERVSRKLRATLHEHALWPWLEGKRGLTGPLVARLIAVIGDPLRFPGQPCSKGHVLAVGFVDEAPCPVTSYEGESCPGTMLPPRSGSGVRPLWAYLGLHVVNGASPRRVTGQRINWNPLGRRLVLGPDGIGDQLIRHSTPKYRELYDRTKARLGVERGHASEHVDGPRPSQIHDIARKVAAKAFVADLLRAWKRGSAHE